MRLFVAVEPGADVTAALDVLMRQLQHRVGRLAPRARITWVQPLRLHLTVRFIGEVPDRQVPAIERALSTPFAIAPFDLTLRGIGVMPPHGPLRVISAGATGGVHEITELARAVDGRLVAVDVRPQSRPFRPHLTIARVRDAAGLRASELLEGLADVRLGTVHVTACTLFESRLRPQGPEYCERVRTALG